MKAHNKHPGKMKFSVCWRKFSRKSRVSFGRAACVRLHWREYTEIRIVCERFAIPASHPVIQRYPYTYTIKIENCVVLCYCYCSLSNVNKLVTERKDGNSTIIFLVGSLRWSYAFSVLFICLRKYVLYVLSLKQQFINPTLKKEIFI